MSPFYRGWAIYYDPKPIPARSFDWSAMHPDYDGAPDGGDGRYLHASTPEAVKAEIDAWIEENEPSAARKALTIKCAACGMDGPVYPDL